ncbi:MAG: DUF420 domain-containing protein [Firmicutes bacterium]|nr:DUF420 domain-containing protein [Bacillota bacterium]
MAANWALVNELFMIASSICAAIGIVYIKRKQQGRHRKWMLTAVTLGACFFVSYVLGSLIVGDTAFGGPKSLFAAYQIFLITHIFLAVVAAIMGVMTVRAALKGNFARHRKIAPWTAVLWFVAAATGLVVYLVLFVIYAPGPTVNLFHAV